MAKLNDFELKAVTIHGEKSITRSFDLFLKRKGQDSQNTSNTYERAVRDFFMAVRGKDIDELKECDLSFTKGEVEDYATELRTHFKTKTVNSSMSAVREFYKKLSDDGFDVNVTAFMIERYKEYDVEKYDALTHEEVQEIINIVSKTRSGRSKALLVRLAYATAFRKESLLELTWEDIINIDGVNFIKTIGKGNKESYKKLSDALHEELMEMKNISDTDKIINLSSKTVQRMMDHIRKEMDFGNRKIVFHSFKKASINEVALLTNGDIKAMQAQGDHANAQTMVDHYLSEKKREDLVVVDTEDTYDLSELDNLSKEEYLKLIKRMDRNTKVKMMVEYKKMQEKSLTL